MVLADHDILRARTEEALKADLVRKRVYVGPASVDVDTPPPAELVDLTGPSHSSTL
jgi:hypothetical protein